MGTTFMRVAAMLSAACRRVVHRELDALLARIIRFLVAVAMAVCLLTAALASIVVGIVHAATGLAGMLGALTGTGWVGHALAGVLLLAIPLFGLLTWRYRVANRKKVNQNPPSA